MMRSPEGQDYPNFGCYLEIVENERLVWTTALAPGYRPVLNPATSEHCDVDLFTAVIALEPAGKGTRYQTLAIHGNAEGKKKHEAMGFHDGWGKALEQLVALARTM